MLKIYFAGLVGLLLSFGLYAQTEPDYAALQKSIKVYQKVLKTDPDNHKVRLELAETYAQLGMDDEAIGEYEKVINDKEGILPIHFKHYADVLKNVGRNDEAAKWYQKQRNAEIAGTALAQGLEGLNLTVNDTAGYFVNNVSFNSIDADFSPVYYNNSLIFVSTRKVKKTNIDEKSGESFYEMFKTDILGEGKFSEPALLLKNLNTKEYEGPLSLSADYGEIYFNKNNLQHAGKKKTGNMEDKLHLAYGKFTGESVQNIKEFEYNDPTFSCTQPALSPDGKELYFVSDMPGGYGEYDLYVSKWENGKWGKPVNMGADINSDWDELYPTMPAPDILYFASQGHTSIGGMDIFYVERKNGKWGEPVNAGMPFNSVYDDFGLVFKNNRYEGFFTSNRPGSVGSDDIWHFRALFPDEKTRKEMQPRLITLLDRYTLDDAKNLNVKGKVLGPDGKPVSDVPIFLMNENGEVLREVSTDENGMFEFKHLKSSNYAVVFGRESKGLKGIVSYDNEDPQLVLDPETKRMQTLSKLPRDSSMLNNHFVTGSLVFNDSKKPAAGVELLLMDEEGNIIDYTVSDEDGNFLFKKLPRGNVYVVSKNKHDNLSCSLKSITDDDRYLISGQEIMALRNTHQVNEVKIVGMAMSNGKPAANTEIYLLQGNKVKKVITNDKGEFVFRMLSGTEYNITFGTDTKNMVANYKLMPDSKDGIAPVTSFDFETLPKDEKGNFAVVGKVGIPQAGEAVDPGVLYLLDNDDNVVASSKADAAGYFVFHKLKKGDYHVVSENPKVSAAVKTTYDDPGVRIDENSSVFDAGKLKKLPSTVLGLLTLSPGETPMHGKTVLLIDESGNIVARTETDKDGNFVFDGISPNKYRFLVVDYQPGIQVSIKNLKAGAKKEVTDMSEMLLFEKAVFFDLRSDKVKPMFDDVIKSFAELAAVKKAARVHIIGYADLAGAESYNQKLSKERAAAVKKALTDAGVPAKKIVIDGVGATDRFKDESQSYIPELNRRVELRYY